MQQFTQNLIVFSIAEWLMISVVFVLLLSLFSFKHQRKQQIKQLLSMQSLQRDLRALTNAAVGVGGRVLEIERYQRKQPVVDVKQTQPTMFAYTGKAAVDSYNPLNQPYEQAIRMAQSGASVDDIINICSLSKSEAELVSMMHRLDKVS